MRPIDADVLPKHEIKDEKAYINPSYARGWNDAIRSVYLYAPTIEAEPEYCWGCNCPKMERITEPVRRGRWIVDEDGNVKCSVCGNGSSNDNFCEHCGARMEEQE